MKHEAINTARVVHLICRSLTVTYRTKTNRRNNPKRAPLGVRLKFLVGYCFQFDSICVRILVQVLENATGNGRITRSIADELSVTVTDFNQLVSRIGIIKNLCICSRSRICSG